LKKVLIFTVLLAPVINGKRLMDQEIGPSLWETNWNK